MTDDKNLATTSFDHAFHTIIGGFKSAADITDRGASTTLLTAGLVTLASAFALKFVVIFEALVSKSVPFSTGDLGILVFGSVIFLLIGSGLRVWDRHMTDKAAERTVRLRIQAAERAGKLFTEAVPPPTMRTQDRL